MSNAEADADELGRGDCPSAAGTGTGAAWAPVRSGVGLLAAAALRRAAANDVGSEACAREDDGATNDISVLGFTARSRRAMPRATAARGGLRDPLTVGWLAVGCLPRLQLHLSPWVMSHAA